MEIEQKARELGWVPQDQFKGDPGKWVDAESFVERGEQVMPILRQNNKKLEEALGKTQAEVNRLTQLFAAAQESMTALKEFHSEHTARAVEEAKAKLLTELKAAKEDGDVELEVKLTDQLTDMKAAEREAGKKKETPPPAPQGGNQQVDPAMQAFLSENSWYGSDARKTARANGIAQVLRSDPENDGLVGKAFFDRIIAEMNGERAPFTSKVSGGTPSGGGSGGKAYADLPPEAKEACARQGKKVVGEGRAFKTNADWQKHYASLYFKE